MLLYKYNNVRAREPYPICLSSSLPPFLFFSFLFNRPPLGGMGGGLLLFFLFSLFCFLIFPYLCAVKAAGPTLMLPLHRFSNTITMDLQQDNMRNKELFAQMDKAVREEMLYTKRDLGRDEMCQMLNIDRNRFANMIRQHSGAPNFCGYLNKLRINYAVMLMRRHANWTLRAIIESCGMSVTPFKRFFKETYGMTPTAYRQQLTRQRNAKIGVSGRPSTTSRQLSSAK